MWYGSSVRRHGRSRPLRAVPRRAGGGGSVGVRGGGRDRRTSLRARASAPYNFTTREDLHKDRRRRRDVAVRQHARVEGRRARRRLRRGRRAQRLPGRGARRRSSTPTSRALLESIQKELFALGARLADPSSRIADRVTKAAVTAPADRAARSRRSIGSKRSCRRCGGSFCQAARRPARCCIWRGRSAAAPSAASSALGADAVEPIVIVYLNRLSDLLFVMARAVNHRAGVPETEW